MSDARYFPASESCRSSPQVPGGRRQLGIAFLAGNFTAWAVVFLFFLFTGYRIGFSTLFEELWGRVLVPSEKILDLPDHIVTELTALNGVLDNAGNPTGQLTHYTTLVHPDEDVAVGWSLNPNARITLYKLRALNPLNLDPPVLALRSEGRISNALSDYIRREARLEYRYTVGPDGFRTTVPVVPGARQILMVGDSVLFGEGVSDEGTMASQLQEQVGDDFRVVNAGVGGFSGEQALAMARKASRLGRYDALIYVACQNDFMLEEGVPYSVQAKQVLQKFAAVRETFRGRVIVLLEPYLQYVLDDILRSSGWWREMVTETDRLRREMPAAAREQGFEFIDGTEVFREYTRQSGTLLGRYGLYADDAHLSPLGNRLAAEKLYEALKAIGLITETRNFSHSSKRARNGHDASRQPRERPEPQEALLRGQRGG